MDWDGNGSFCGKEDDRGFPDRDSGQRFKCGSIHLQLQGVPCGSLLRSLSGRDMIRFIAENDPFPVRKETAVYNALQENGLSRAGTEKLTGICLKGESDAPSIHTEAAEAISKVPENKKSPVPDPIRTETRFIAQGAERTYPNDMRAGFPACFFPRFTACRVPLL